MVLDAFITWFLRHKARSYLTFEELGTVVTPRAPAHPIHLYLHIPFCAQLCPYCSFHRVSFDEPLTRAYFQALREEIRIYHALGFRFADVYIGGGTPTILMEELIETLALIRDLFAPQNISVETNPDRLDRETLATLAAQGVGRVSVGVQTFDDTILKLIGRYEKYGSGTELKDKLRSVRGIVQTLNIDMIYNFPVQTQDQLLADLGTLDEIQPDQITFYPLMVSDATLSAMTKIMGRHSFMKERRFYELITSHLRPAYQRGSAWCFSRGAGMIDEYIVTHDEYIGAGSGAFGLVQGAIYANTFSIPNYIQALSHHRLPVNARKVFTSRELARYTFLMDLFGLHLDRSRFRQKFGRDVWQVLFLECLFFTLIGALSSDAEALRVNERGCYYWVIMMREFFTGVDNFRDLGRLSAGADPLP